MKLRLCLYFLKQAFINIINNRIVHLIGVGTMVVSMLIFGTFLILFANLNTWIHGWGHSLSMSVYLQDGIDKSTKDKIASSISAFSSAEIERYISKDDALKDLRMALGSESGLLDGLSSNPLPASFEVIFKNVESPDTDPQRIKKALEAMVGVDEVQYSEEWMKRFEGLMSMVRLVGFIIGGLLGIGVLFIVTNTIKLTIHSRKHEIEIQKMVGATDWFVKIPFLLEGMIQGILSGTLSVLVLFLGYLFFSAERVHLLGLAVFDFSFLPREYILAIFFISVLLGLVGSFIAVGRFIAADSSVDI
ncbi:MAG: ABC transporter permease [Deltaproteobacteria bacterium]|nr:ABC transporter permease [Deltaproteobacteria bacterium]